jgi:hypothetical protein
MVCVVIFVTVWREYLKAGNGFAMVPLIAMFSVLMQIAAGVNAYTLVWWEAKYVHIKTTFKRKEVDLIVTAHLIGLFTSTKPYTQALVWLRQFSLC